jgi:hypothetical protein
MPLSLQLTPLGKGIACMAKEKKSKKEIMAEKYPDVVPNLKLAFTGIARSVVCYSNNGVFRNFKIVTLTLEDGMVVDVKHSDPYATFEVISRMEIANEIAIHHLNNNWKDGRTLSK